MLYSIEIRFLPEPSNGRKCYFWIILGINAGMKYNCGFGWAETVESAAKEAVNYYQTIREAWGFPV